MMSEILFLFDRTYGLEEQTDLEQHQMQKPVQQVQGAIAKWLRRLIRTAQDILSIPVSGRRFESCWRRSTSYRNVVFGWLCTISVGPSVDRRKEGQEKGDFDWIRSKRGLTSGGLTSVLFRTMVPATT